MIYLAAAAAIASLAAHETPVVLGFIALLFCWMGWKKEPFRRCLRICAFAALVFIVQDLRAEETAALPASYRGKVAFQGGYTIDGGSMRGLAELDGGRIAYVRYRFASAEEQKTVEEALPGVVLFAAGQFELPSPAAHRFSFDMARYLKNNGASAILEILKLERMEPLDTIGARLAVQRKKLQRHIRGTFPESLATEAEALLIGEQGNMGPEERQVYQTLGITHLFAISGLHVAILSGLLYFLLIRLHVRKEAALILLLFALPIYAVLAGSAPSVLRSVAMVCIVLFGRLMKINVAIADVLLSTFILFILWDPYMMYNIGFQLSYGATFAIIYSAKFLGGADSSIVQGLLLTCISQLTLFPLLLYHFYEVSLSAFFVNSLFVPLYTVVILPVNLVLLGLTLIHLSAAEALFALYVPVRGWVGDFMEVLAAVPHQMWNPGKPPLWLVLLFFACLIIFYSLAEKGFRWRQMAFILVPAAAFTAAPYLNPALKVAFLDVGQGDSAVIELPYRKGVYVIDTGGVLRFQTESFQETDRPYEVGRQVVVPYLKGSGISTVDLLVLSHADADHVEGADELFKLLEIEKLHLSPGSEKEGIMQELAPFAGEAAVEGPLRGASWQEAGVRFSYLSPQDLEYDGNDDSLVLLLESGEFKLLFTGDLEAGGERELLSSSGARIAGLDILKVAHHGSKTSSTKEFLAAAAPSLSIFSTGKDNRYGHPAPEVVERFQKLGLTTMNTAENGTIEVKVEGGRAEISPMR